MSTASLHITKPLLEDVYLKQGLSTRQCAEVLDIPLGSMRHYFKKFDIKARSVGFQKGNKLAEGNTVWLGRKHDKLARKKMSKSAKKRGIAEDTQKKMAESRIGTKQSQEWIKKRIAVHYGHTRNCGHKNPNWQGGIQYEPYCSAWGDEEFREDIRERDNHQCQNPDCWGTGDRICIHHIDYEKRNCHPDNLITLCSSCNVRANYDREWHTAYYNAFMQRSGKTIST